MNLTELAQQNPIIAMIIIVCAAIGVAWKVFDALYVKPRNFKIDSLKDDMGKLQEQLIRLQRTRENQALLMNSEPQLPSQAQSEFETVVADPISPIPDTRLKTDASLDPVLTSLRACYSMWMDENSTKLQKQKFETDYTGKHVCWTVAVESVSEQSHDKIYLHVKEPTTTTDWDLSRAMAEFPTTEHDMLLSVKKGDRIELRGAIKDFFLWPRLTDCSIKKLLPT